jgi:hypothetical protein
LTSPKLLGFFFDANSLFIISWLLKSASQCPKVIPLSCLNCNLILEESDNVIESFETIAQTARFFDVMLL